MACGQASILLERLENNTGQKPAFRAADALGFLMQIVKNEAGDWLVLLTNPKTGVGCVAHFGDGFEAVPDDPVDGGSTS